MHSGGVVVLPASLLSAYKWWFCLQCVQVVGGGLSLGLSALLIRLLWLQSRGVRGNVNLSRLSCPAEVKDGVCAWWCVGGCWLGTCLVAWMRMVLLEDSVAWRCPPTQTGCHLLKSDPRARVTVRVHPWVGSGGAAALLERVVSSASSPSLVGTRASLCKR